jgi:hypothetical protein
MACACSNLPARAAQHAREALGYLLPPVRDEQQPVELDALIDSVEGGWEQRRVVAVAAAVWAARTSGDGSRARRYLDRLRAGADAIDGSEEVGEKSDALSWVAHFTADRSVAELGVDRPDEAIRLCERALEFCRDHGTFGPPRWRAGFALASALAGQPSQAASRRRSEAINDALDGVALCAADDEVVSAPAQRFARLLEREPILVRLTELVGEEVDWGKRRRLALEQETERRRRRK